jgi:signal transduction histidine kinase
LIKNEIVIKMKAKMRTIEEVKTQIINTSLIVASVIGTLAYLVSLSRLFKFGFHISFVINFLIIASVITITLFRSHISILLKTYVIISLIILLSLFDAFNYGLLSVARIYLILIPFFSILYLPLKRSLVVFIGAILCFLCIGYLHHTGILKLPDEYNPVPYMLEMYPWIIIAVHITAVAVIILLVVQKFIQTYSGLISDLEVLVEERTKNIESANQELTTINQELFNQREELETALDSLQNAQKQLIQSEKMASLGVLSSGVAHEINNPLNFIYGGMLGIENYINENLNDHREKLMPMIEGIREGTSRAADIVKSLSRFSRQDDHYVTQSDIHTIIDNCLMIINNQLKFRIEIHKNYTEEPHLLLCNEGKLHQAILNILINASQAIDEKGTISITTQVKQQKLIISITDTGCGISPENLPKITDPFFTTKDPGKGIGLGLTTVYNTVEEHNGTLKFDSQLGKGTKVTITLPIKRIE